jgi:hypothetical protein
MLRWGQIRLFFSLKCVLVKLSISFCLPASVLWKIWRYQTTHCRNPEYLNFTSTAEVTCSLIVQTLHYSQRITFQILIINRQYCTKKHLLFILRIVLKPGNKLGSRSGTRAISTTSRRQPSSSFFSPLKGKVPKEIHTILTETLACFLPVRTKDLSAPLYGMCQNAECLTVFTYRRYWALQR